MQVDMNSLSIGQEDNEEDLNTQLIYAKSKLGDLNVQLKKSKKDCERAKTAYGNANLRMLTLENYVKSYKHKLRAIKWSLMGIRPGQLESIERILINVQRKKPIQWCFPVLENMKKEMRVRSDLNKVVENQIEDGEEKNHMMDDLVGQIDLMKQAKELKKEMYRKLFRSS